MFRKLLIAGVLLAILPTMAMAQSGKLRGRVTDKDTSDPLIGVNVTIQGTNLGAATDVNGDYVVLGVPPGTYTVSADYISYQKQSIANIRVSSGLTTTLDYALQSSSIELEELEIVAERPLVQRNTTNTVRMTTQEDIENLPIRGTQNILALNAGVVQQNGTLYVRGGRSGEVMYFVDGVSATNPQGNFESISVIQEAIEEIQMQAGGFTAEYGGSNSGVVNTQMRTGGNKLQGSLDYRTDDFASEGDEFLGTTSRGYHNGVATIGGPLGEKLRFFLAGQYNSQANRTAQFIDPFSFADSAAFPEFQIDDGLEGRTAGDPLPSAIEFKKNWLPDNSSDFQDLQGTLRYNLNNAINLRFSGTYRATRTDNGKTNFFNSINNYFDNTPTETNTKRGMMALRWTHLLNANTFYEVNVNWTGRYSKNIDPFFGDDWKSYADSSAWSAAGREPLGWLGIYQQPRNYSIIRNFRINAEDEYKNSYNKSSQESLGISAAFSTQLNKNIELKVGGRADSWTIRNFNVGNIAGWLRTENGTNGQTPNQYIDITGSGLTPEFLRLTNLTRFGGITNIGWDYNGENKIDDGVVGARTPLFASGYFQTKFEYRDLILNLGLRYELLDIGAWRPEVIEEPVTEKETNWIDEESLIEMESYSYLLPRVNFAFPVTDNTVFYAQYGKYVQNPATNNYYRSVGGFRNFAPGVRGTGTRATFLAKPERTNQYELGIRQTLTDDFAFTVTAYYKDQLDLWRNEILEADGSGELAEGTRFLGYISNNDIATSKGLETTLELRRTKRLAAKINYTLGSTKGTGSTRFSSTAVTSLVVDHYPNLIYALNNNQSHRGSAMLDYRFARGDGKLEGFGINALLTFNSGHNYTKIREPFNLGQASPWNVGVRATGDVRTRNPVEPLNSSTTPWVFNLDVNIDKMFYFDKFNVKVYGIVQNFLNTRNIINVYQTTGIDDDDGWLKHPLAEQFRASAGYEDLYRAINLDNGWGWTWATGGQLWAAPRQIRFGLSFQFR